MISIKYLAIPLRIVEGAKVMTGYRSRVVIATVLFADHKHDRYVLQFKTKSTGLVVLVRKRYQLDVVDDATIVEEVNEENEEAEEFVHLEMM